MNDWFEPIPKLGNMEPKFNMYYLRDLMTVLLKKLYIYLNFLSYFLNQTIAVFTHMLTKTNDELISWINLFVYEDRTFTDIHRQQLFHG